MSRDLECFVVVESGSLRLQNTASDNISPMVSVFGEALKGFNCLARLIIVQDNVCCVKVLLYELKPSEFGSSTRSFSFPQCLC